MKLDFDTTKPIYAQIINYFTKGVVRGELLPGDKIPSQREFAEAAKVNPNTVQRAYREMEQMELVETLRGQGTFIKDNQELFKRMKLELASQAVKTFISEMMSLGYNQQETAELILKERWS